MRSRLALLSLTLLLVAPVLHASWSRAGLFGADVRALVVDPQNPDTFYLGTSHGDVYVSTDGARTWANPYSGTPFPGYVVDSLVLDDRGRLWAASWGLWGGGVIAVSENGGRSWKRRDSSLEEFSVRALAVNPCNADDLVAGGLTGVYRSIDSGDSWQKISSQENVESLAIDPRNADRIYVGTWRLAFRTDDGGKKWKTINDGVVLDTDVFSIRIDPNDPDNIWMSTCGWVYNSSDGGDTFTRFRDGFNNRRIHDIAFDPRKSSVLYAGSVAGLYRTPNNGKTWELVTDESVVINAIALTPMRPSRIVLGTEGDGVYISEDRGKTFVRSSEGLYNVRVASVVADPEHRDRVYAAVFFGNAASGIYGSADGGESWDRVSKTKLPEILSLVIQPQTEPRFVAGSEKGFYFSNDGVDWTLAEPSTRPLRVEKVLPYNRLRLFAATSEGVFTSRDSGRSWYRLAETADRTIDIAIGEMENNRALFALTASGVTMFNGERWSAIGGSPLRGRALTVRDGSTIVVASAQGAQAGRVTSDLQWEPLDGKAAAREATPLWSALEQRGMMDGNSRKWRNLSLPVESRDVASVAVDPFDENRLFIATIGHGIFVFDNGAFAGTVAKNDRKKEVPAQEVEKPRTDPVIYLSGSGGGSQ